MHLLKLVCVNVSKHLHENYGLLFLRNQLFLSHDFIVNEQLT